MVRYCHRREIAYRFTLEIKGNVQEYALSLLNIINHTRVYPHAFYKVENTDSNKVYVVCAEHEKDNVREYLENFGEIQREEKINWFVISAEYDQRGWDELWESNDYDTDFTVEIE